MRAVNASDGWQWTSSTSTAPITATWSITSGAWSSVVHAYYIVATATPTPTSTATNTATATATNTKTATATNTATATKTATATNTATATRTATATATRTATPTATATAICNEIQTVNCSVTANLPNNAVGFPVTCSIPNVIAGDSLLIGMGSNYATGTGFVSDPQSITTNNPVDNCFTNDIYQTNTGTIQRGPGSLISIGHCYNVTGGNKTLTIKYNGSNTPQTEVFNTYITEVSNIISTIRLLTLQILLTHQLLLVGLYFKLILSILM